MRLKKVVSCLFFVVLLLGLAVPNAGLTYAQSKIPPQAPPTPKTISVVPQGDLMVIFVINDLNGQRTQVAAVPMALNHPLFADFISLSPDGEKVLYVTAENSALYNAEFWVAKVDGTGSTRIAQFPADLWPAVPQWAPDSGQIAYVTKSIDSAPEDGLTLWSMNEDGSQTDLVYQNGAFKPHLFDYIPKGVLSWSEDGTGLVFKDRFSTPPQAYTVTLADHQISQVEIKKDPALMAAPEKLNAPNALPCTVPVFRQKDYGDNMKTCNISISGAGCALTSTAMVLKYYGVNTDPPHLNACLGNNACPLIWASPASNCSEGKVSGNGFKLGFSYATIDQQLAAGKPVIVWMRTKSGGTHFVVVTGGSGQRASGYTINDPADGTSTKTLANYSNNGWTLNELDLYSGTPGCNLTHDIVFDTPLNGNIDTAGKVEDYYFTVAVSDNIEVTQTKNNSNLDSFLILYGPDGKMIAQDDDSGGSYNADLHTPLSSAGRYRISAKGFSSSTGAYIIKLTHSTTTPSRWITYGQSINSAINPNSAQDTYYFNGVNGRSLSIHMNRTSGALDPFLELYGPDNAFLANNDDGGGSQNSWLVITLPATGNFRIVARSFNRASSGNYSLSMDNLSSNLARGKSVWASSVEFNGAEGWKATDGDINSRWSSQYSDPQQITIDLGSNVAFNQVVVKWERAYGKRFGVYYWTGSQWHNVFWTDNGQGGTNTINFSTVTARYVALYGAQRGMNWGYSVWEFEIYNTTTTLIPLVPPDDPGKVDVTALAPLPPVQGDKEIVYAGDGAGGQELVPLAGSDPQALTSAPGTPQTVSADILSPSELDGLFTPVDSVRFTGIASSQGSDGNPIAITAYQWRSDVSGVFGTQVNFVLPTTALPPGWHTIYFKAQNASDAWSDEVTTQIFNQWPFSVFLPGAMGH